jgi:hypothetical protein
MSALMIRIIVHLPAWYLCRFILQMIALKEQSKINQ